MVFFDGLTTKTDVANRATTGKQMIPLPATGLPETDIRLPGCAGCPKELTHNPCSHIGILPPVTETRYDRIPADEQLNDREGNRLTQTLWLLHYILYGYIDYTLLNVGAGTANNAAHQVRYEILGVDGENPRRIQVRGPNPRRITLQRSSVNPDWPFDGEGRLIFEDEVCSLPTGAMVQLEWPSVLSVKLTPLVTKVEPPATNDPTADFWLNLSFPVENATTPYDATYPPWNGVYYLNCIWYQAFPDDWGNWQPPREAWFTLKTETLTGDEARALPGGIKPLTDILNGATRVLWPGSLGAARAMEINLYDSASGYRALSDGEIEAILTTTQTGAGAWETELDLSGFQTPGLEWIQLVWRPEATGDADPARIPFPGQCANAQRDPSQSYTHDGEDFCASAGSTQFPTFRAGCWQPNCDGFCLGHESQSFRGERMTRRPGDGRLPNYWADFWTRCSWLMGQQVSGSSALRNFYLSKPAGGGPSVAEILGGWANEVPGALVGFQVSYWPPAMGRLETTIDGGGNHSYALRHGAFFEQPTATDPTDAWNLTRGLLSQALGAAWDRVGALGDSEGEPRDYPLGCAKTGIYSWGTGGSWLERAQVSADGPENGEYYMVAVFDDGTEDDVAAEMREWFN